MKEQSCNWCVCVCVRECEYHCAVSSLCAPTYRQKLFALPGVGVGVGGGGEL